jgi:hypothetical protein
VTRTFPQPQHLHFSLIILCLMFLSSARLDMVRVKILLMLWVVMWLGIARLGLPWLGKLIVLGRPVSR